MHAEGMKLALFYFVQCMKNGQNCLFVGEAVALNLSLKCIVCMCAGWKERHENNVSMSEILILTNSFYFDCFTNVHCITTSFIYLE